MSRTHLTRSILNDLHTFWFKSCPTRPDVAIPGEVMKKWFVADEANDSYCRDQYLPALQDARSMSASEIRKVAQNDAEEVAAVILLDQIPRNIFRGGEASQAYNTFDPKARELCKTLLDEGYGDTGRLPTFGHGMFLYMPLMHSEQLSDHQLSSRLLDKRTQECNNDEEKEMIKRIVDFEDKHRKVIEQFGRYPSRNEALGRESTEEEKKHLESGPGW